ncbi:MAG: DNA polymerase subunit beta [Alphaproteobacteria bacterium CG11_big_fil_rev_8_21_14_0_20_39_49]|nr:MAG: DNA polymerase subunit beta [Alphaproteobacteria bacterium CG11_big_fil_rev_8_21_14_0_20_39_49]
MTNFNDLQKRRDEILALSKEFGAENIRVFGSVARGEEKENSDVDILVSMQKNRSYFDLIAFQNSLEDLLHTKVDVLSDRGLYHSIKEQILNEAKPI